MTRNVLFLCTANSARSILAEALLNQLGRGRLRGYSAGSFPRGQVNPLALELLQELGFPTRELRSKGWEEFARPGVPEMDFVITVCDQAAGEVCPVWPGRPVAAHWGIPDPASAAGEDAMKRAAFRTALDRLRTRIQLFVSLPLEGLDRLRVKDEMARIGRMPV